MTISLFAIIVRLLKHPLRTGSYSVYIAVFALLIFSSICYVNC